MNSPVDFCLKLLSAFDTGNIFLTTGDHVHKITTRNKPDRVWLSEVSAGIPVCNGDVNTYGVKLVEDGFILVAHVKTDTVNLSWQSYSDESMHSWVV